jgi:hypothetical protein
LLIGACSFALDRPVERPGHVECAESPPVLVVDLLGGLATGGTAVVAAVVAPDCAIGSDSCTGTAWVAAGVLAALSVAYIAGVVHASHVGAECHRLHAREREHRE